MEVKQMIHLKEGVKLHGLTPEMNLGIQIVHGAYLTLGYICVVTSVSDGEHMKGSLHYKGCAADFRIKQLSKNALARLPGLCRARLGDDFDVVLEQTHLHVEWDPKEETNVVVAEAGLEAAADPAGDSVDKPDYVA